MMLGSECSPCCSKCGCPAGESLPSAVTVTFSGLTKEATYVENLLGLKISACHGTGATGTVSGTGGKPDEGFPLTGVTLTSGGSGYAQFGRVAPTLNISGSGTGATFTPSFSVANDSCGLPRWSIQSISVSGGTGYSDNEELTISVSSGGTSSSPAEAAVVTGRKAPSITGSPTGAGSGAAITVSQAPNGTTPETWSVTKLSLVSGGSAYPSTGQVAFDLGTGAVFEVVPFATYYTVRTAPTLSLNVLSSSGDGASLSPVVSTATGVSGQPVWTITDATIVAGGSGYALDDFVDVIVSDGESDFEGFFLALVSDVDEDGSITAVTFYEGGAFFKNTGVIGTLILNDGGRYYATNGVPESVVVLDGGAYYGQDKSATPYVAAVTVSVTQAPPSAGAGAVISAVVDSNTSSPTFGAITGLALDNGGDDYLSWSYLLSDCPVSDFNGKSILLERTGPESCEYSKCYGRSNLSVVFYGDGSPPTVRISRPSGVSGGCAISFSANVEDAPFSCSTIDFTATELLGGTAAVVAGDSETIASCDDLWNAAGIIVEVESQDYLAKYRRLAGVEFGGFTCEHTVAATVGFAGSAFAGEFELTPFGIPTVSSAGTQKRFRYYYESHPQICGTAYLDMVLLRRPNGTYRFESGLTGLTTIIYRDHDAETYKAIDELTCDTIGVFNASCSGARQQNLFGGFSEEARCLCDIDSTTGYISEPSGFWPSDESSTMFPDKWSVSGSGAVAIRFVQVVNE